MDLTKPITELNEALKDKEYRYGWISNIAMAQIDAEAQYRRENNKVGKRLNYKDRHAIANMGAENFLNVLNK